MRPPIYLGNGEAIAFMRGGEPIAVDTTSIDALDYLLSWDVERDVMSLFQALLRPDTVFVDVGANFGLFTAIASSTILRSGTLIAIEPNPKTYKLLERTAYCNQILKHPRVQLLNLAANDVAGEKLRLRVPAGRLGSASMWLDQTIPHQEVVVGTCTLDDIVPDALPVDLVKIDAEGHEPYILRGMRRIIERSPEITIIMEFTREFIECSFGSADAFLNDISSYGLSLSVIGQRGAVTQLSSASDLGASQNIVLSKSHPDSRKIIVRAKDFVRSDITNGMKLCDDGQGQRLILEQAADDNRFCLLYGPYIRLPEGRYIAKFEGEISGQLEVRFTSDFGKLIGEHRVTDFTANLPLSAEADLRNFEIVCMKGESPLEQLVIERVVLQRV